MFFSALFLIAKVWNQPKHPLMDKWIKKTWCVYVYMYIMYVFVYVYARIIHNGIFLTHKKKKDENLAICDNVDEAGHYAK